MAGGSRVVTKRLSVVASNVAAHISEVSRDAWERILAEIPQLRGDEIILNILKAGVEENISTMLHVFENDMPLENVEGPASALDYARRLAQRNVPISALIRAYRIGHCRYLQWCLDELHRQEPDAEEAMGHPLHERRTDLEVALLAVQYLGSPLLLPAVP
ncbi:hypothetical protein ACFVT2_13140 [Streptomyces sp. NPDC058000]|uniref:hypothetical protein n=1 Tax=Streptomyces sp. NPDC058000 TaxID=3346299 RepID=UPI0036E0C4BF